MRGGRAGCGDCLPCDTDCLCAELQLYSSTGRRGCCDCGSLFVLIAWNFSGITDTYTTTPCPDPASFSVTPRTMPAGLAARIAAHGGVQQVELYANTCPDGADIPIATSMGWPSGHFLLNQGSGGLLCYLDHTGTGLCDEPGVCDFRLADPAAVCWVLRANDGSELIRCGICVTGEDLVLPACSSSSSSSASSEVPSDSSGSSGSLSSSSGSGSGDGSSDSSGSSSLSSSSGSSDSSSSSSSGSGDGSGGGSSGSSSSEPPSFIFTTIINSQNIPLL